MLADEYEEFLASYDCPPDVGLRINTLKLTESRFKEISPFDIKPIPWSSAGFLVSPDSRPGKHAYHTAGLYYLQDPSAMAVAELLDPQPGERILDLAAAPGGKTTHIAALMQGKGLLAANDLNNRRAQVLAKNLERWGARNTVVLNETPPRLVAHFGPVFDRVLVDAPCSGEAMFRKDPDARTEWFPKLVDSCAQRQDAILADAARLVRPGGVLVYATCAFSPQEDEGTIARFLEDHPNFEVLKVAQHTGFSPGRPDWLEDQLAYQTQVRNTIRLWPHKAPGEGHFIAVLRKAGNRDEKSWPSWSPAPLSAEASGYFGQFCDQTLKWAPERDSLAFMGSHLYQVPASCPDLHGLRVLHWGWWLGTMKTKRFEPSHALAMGLQADQFTNSLRLQKEDLAVERYLRGEVLSSLGTDGWTVVTLDGFPLGWGKRVQGRLKTHLPKWLRQF